MNKLSIKSPKQIPPARFRSLKQFRVRLNKDQIGLLVRMIGSFHEVISEEDSELEILILTELQVMLEGKLNIISAQSTIVMNGSQAYTLFLWLNQTSFVHPLEESLSCQIVDLIYKQVV